jgi:hypothetical protein
MQIRKLSHQEIEMIVEYLQAMLDEMASFGGHVFQESNSGSNWLLDCIQSQIDSSDHLFLGVELDAASSQLIGILEASVANSPPVSYQNHPCISTRFTLSLRIVDLELHDR